MGSGAAEAAMPLSWKGRERQGRGGEGTSPILLRSMDQMHSLGYEIQGQL